MDDELLLTGLDRLAEVCDPGTKVMVVGAQNDIALYRALMRRGACRNTSWSRLHPAPAADPRHHLASTPTRPPPFVGRTLAFLGAKGGCRRLDPGAQRRPTQLAETVQANTVIVDLRPCRSAPRGSNFNQDPLQGVADALSKPDRLDPVLLDRMTARCTEHLGLFAAPGSLDEDYEISADTYEEVTAARFAAPRPMWCWTCRTSGPAGCGKTILMPPMDDGDRGRHARPRVACATPRTLIDLIKKARPNDSPAAPRC